jgi:hypothetical protein
MTLRILLQLFIFIVMANALALDWTPELMEQFRDKCLPPRRVCPPFQKKSFYPVQKRYLPDIWLRCCEG